MKSKKGKPKRNTILWKRVKYYSIAGHRYLGFLLSLLFVIWFLSGFVMMYADFPVWNTGKQLSHAEPVDAENVQISVSEAAQIAGMGDSWGSVKLEMMLDRPMYRFEDEMGARAHIYADTGDPLDSVSNDMALDIAWNAYGEEVRIQKSEQLDRQDQWIPQQANVRYLPYFRFKLDDPEKTWIYVSESGGELFQIVTGRERFLSWIGPIPHWIYFRDLRVHAGAWRDVIIWIAGIGTIMCLLGIVTGCVRFTRKRRKKRTRTVDKVAFSPYKDGWFRYHHYTGFLFGLVIFTWTLSGLLSVNPWGLSPPRSLTAEENRAWKGGDPVFSEYDHPMSQIVAGGKSMLGEVRRVELRRFSGEPWYRLYDGEGKILSVGFRDEELVLRQNWEEKELLAAIQDVASGKPLLDVETLHEYDHYYYSRDGTAPLPVIRIRYEDPANTWYYMDPARAEVSMKNETASRRYRWLYNGLHSLDFSFLMNRRPLWDAVVIFLMVGGTVSSITGLYMTWRWLRPKKS